MTKKNVSSIDQVLNQIVKEGDTDVSFPEPILSENALTVLKKRYLIKDDEGKVTEQPRDLFVRVAQHIASAEKRFEKDIDTSAIEKRFFTMMAEKKFLPNSPTLMNAGRSLGQLSACFVISEEESGIIQGYYTLSKIP